MALAVTQPLLSNLNGMRNTVPKTPFPFYVNHHAMAGATNETVPAAATSVIITPDSAGAWFCFGSGTAVVPNGAVVDGSGSFFVAGGVSRVLSVAPGQIISAMPASGTVNASFEYFQ